MQIGECVNRQDCAVGCADGTMLVTTEEVPFNMNAYGPNEIPVDSGYSTPGEFPMPPNSMMQPVPTHSVVPMDSTQPRVYEGSPAPGAQPLDLGNPATPPSVMELPPITQTGPRKLPQIVPQSVPKTVSQPVSQSVPKPNASVPIISSSQFGSPKIPNGVWETSKVKSSVSDLPQINSPQTKMTPIPLPLAPPKSTPHPSRPQRTRPVNTPTPLTLGTKPNLGSGRQASLPGPPKVAKALPQSVSRRRAALATQQAKAPAEKKPTTKSSTDRLSELMSAIDSVSKKNAAIGVSIQANPRSIPLDNAPSHTRLDGLDQPVRRISEIPSSRKTSRR